MAEHGDEDTIGVVRINQNCADLLTVSQAHVFPGFSAVRGLVDTVTGREIRSLQALTTADVQDVGVRRRDGQGADGAGRLVVEDRRPHPAIVGCLPHAAVVDADKEDVRLRDTRGGYCSSSAKRPDHPPAEAAIKISTPRLLARRGSQAIGNEYAERKSQRTVQEDKLVPHLAESLFSSGM
jgi:hypothetical protein